jgi:hypothetical protein
MSTPSHTDKQPSSPPHAFVDSIESGLVKLLLQDESGQWRAHSLPATILPTGTKEGTWFRLVFQPSDPPAEQQSEAALRQKLSQADQGGDFSL